MQPHSCIMVQEGRLLRVQTQQGEFEMSHSGSQEGRAFDAQNEAIPLAGEHKQAEIRDARSAGDMWRAIGADSWVFVPIASSARPGHSMEGTRLTLVRALCL